MCSRLSGIMGWVATFGRILIQQQLLSYHGDGTLWDLIWEEVSNTFMLEWYWRRFGNQTQIIQETTDKIWVIQTQIRTAQSRQKSYIDQKRRPLEFEVGDKVFLKVSPTKGVKRFNVHEKLSPRIIWPYDIIEKMNKVAFHIALP